MIRIKILTFLGCAWELFGRLLGLGFVVLIVTSLWKMTASGSNSTPAQEAEYEAYLKWGFICFGAFVLWLRAHDGCEYIIRDAIAGIEAARAISRGNRWDKN